MFGCILDKFVTPAIKTCFIDKNSGSVWGLLHLCNTGLRLIGLQTRIGCARSCMDARHVAAVVHQHSNKLTHHAEAYRSFCHFSAACLCRLAPALAACLLVPSMMFSTTKSRPAEVAGLQKATEQVFIITRTCSLANSVREPEQQGRQQVLTQCVVLSKGLVATLLYG